MDSMWMANELGTILASEEYCGLTFSQDAIAEWIDQNIDPSDMGFSGTLQMMTEGARYNLGGMGASRKTAHCRSIERSARHYGFVE